MQHRVHLQFKPDYEAYEPIARQAGEAALAHACLTPGDVTVVLTDNERLRALNREYAQTDAPTDVLSFPDGSLDPDSGRVYLGDVVIAVPLALEQAQRGGHSPSSEIALLAVHGILHLLGHKHHGDLDRTEMWHVQREIMESLGYGEALPGRSI
jgi:probable rRNA maturation factor